MSTPPDHASAFTSPSPSENLQTATLAGGCFWCLEAVFSRLHGVHAVESGYCGGHSEQADYASVCRGQTGHAEAVRITFHPQQISYETLLEVFFSSHDPTTLDRQGHDVGSQYRSMIYTHSSAQDMAAHNCVEKLNASGQFSAPIVTRIEPAGAFHPAEEEHQDYYQNHPYQGYCLMVIRPKLLELARHHADKLKDTTLPEAQ